MPIIFFICSFIILGVAFGLSFNLQTKVLLLIILPIYSLFIFFYFTRKNLNIFLIILLLVAFSIGFLRASIQIIDVEIPVDEGKFIVSGNVVSDEEDKNNYSRYLIDDVEVQSKVIDSKILVYEPFPSDCKFGDNFSAFGRLVVPSDFYTDTGRVFPYKNFLAKDNIKYLFFVSGDNEDPCSSTNGYSFSKGISDIRGFFLTIMRDILPEPESSLLAGLILGVRGFLSDDLLEVFRVTGLVHIIVLSGYNVTLVAEAIRRIFSFLPKNLGIWISIFSIIFFVLLAGAGTVAIRAGIMASIALFAKLLRRESDGIRALLFAGTIMVLVNPSILFFDVSFHLSFLATIGLLLYGPIFERKILFITDRFQFRGIVAATLSTQLFILPYLAYQIGEVSIIGVIANLLVLPLVPIAMGMGVIGSVLGIIFPPALVTPFVYPPLKAIISLAEFFATFPFASVSLPYLSIFFMFIGYIILFFPIFLSKNSPQPNSN